MPIARSKVTAQGQISVPAEVRRKLGVGPGSVPTLHPELSTLINVSSHWLRLASRNSQKALTQLIVPPLSPSVTY